MSSNTTFSIEIFNGTSCENNAYGVDPMDVMTQMRELLDQTALDLMFSDDGLDIQIRKEQ